MAGQIQWHGCLDDEANEGTGVREPAPEEDVCRRATESRDGHGGDGKKVVRL